MPRTRGLKPEFVDHRGFSLPRLVYSGDMLTEREVRAAFKCEWNTSHVYHVFDRDGGLLYVGMTRSIDSRWSRHKRKAPWWTSAQVLNIYLITAVDHLAAELGARHWESVAINGALPAFNLQGPATLPAKVAKS